MPEARLETEQYKRRCEEQSAQLVDLARANLALSGTIDELRQTIDGLHGTIDGLHGTIGELKETIRELQGKLNSNSKNSSRHPSKDGFNKPRPRARREKGGRKPGGQAGHAGAHMDVPHEPDEVLRHLPATCLSCPHLAECTARGDVFACGERRYEVNVVVGTRGTEYRSMEVAACPCGKTVPGVRFPENIRAHVQYGDSVTVLAGLLNTYGAVSFNRIRVLLGSLMGVGLSTGTVAAMTSRCAGKVGGTLAAIREMLAKECVVHFDETGTYVNGKTVWVHNSSTPRLTFQVVDAKRRQDGMEAGGVLPDFRGVAVHDCWKSYWKYGDATHAVCCAHLLRELTWVEESGSGHGWATRFKSLLLGMKRAKERTMARERTEISRYYSRKFDAEYDSIIKEAEAACPEPPAPPGGKRGRRKKGKERSLIERLKELKGSICLFLHNFAVPFDNNQAERDIRNVKTKVSGCFRTERGAQDYLDVMSYL